ncbi:MAG: phage adaptor protein [Paracoccaceae bacterium]
MTYNELVTAVQDYCENNFPTTDMDTMIRQAEQRIYNTVQIANLRKNVTGSLSSGNKYLACPEDFLSVYSLAIYPQAGGEYLYLLNKDVNFMREAYPNPATTGKPKHYAIFGSQSNDVAELTFILGPTPDAAYNAELHYYYYPESIVTAGTTWLGDNFDSALLNGTIYEAALYMRMEQDSVKLVSERYVQAIALLKNLGDGKQRMDAYRDGQVRVQVS